MNQFNKVVTGFSLVEMLVVLVILSILAATAKPFIEVGLQRQKESELRQALRTIRTALDKFHKDCEDQKFSVGGNFASRYCYPLELEILVDGVEIQSVEGKENRRYLRRIPLNPFLKPNDTIEEHWEIRGYLDELDSNFWDGEDVYDVRPQNEGTALNESQYRDW